MSFRPENESVILFSAGPTLSAPDLQLDELRLRLLAGVEKAIEVREEFPGQLRHDD
jgi:hypothetical protein